jgi:signal transduction histidine kinase
MSVPDDQLRREFLDYNRDFRIRTSKMGCFLALVLMPAGTLLDWFVYPGEHGYFLALRLACALLAGVIWLLLSWPSFARRWFQQLGLSWFLLPSAFICWMIYETEGVQSPYYAGLTLVLIAVSWVAQVTVAESAIAFALTLLMYLAACFGHGGADARMLFNNLYFIVLTGVVMLTGNYFLNSMRFREFALRHEVDAARREIEASHRRLQELDQMKSRFFANISHELRTPLTLLIAPLDRLRSTGPAALPPQEAGSLLDLMHANALRLLKLINDLLDLVRVQSGTPALRLQSLDLAPFLHGLVQAARPLAGNKNLTLHASIAPDLGPAAFDADRLEKIILNLLFNAIKFTPAPGTVTLHAAGDARTLRITVEDTGPGIDPSIQDKIFDPFWQADAAGTRAAQGAGLGLALVKELTEAHGGTITVDSAPGRGTRMRLQFPRRQAPTAPADPANPTDEWLAALYRRAEHSPAHQDLPSPETRNPKPETPALPPQTENSKPQTSSARAPSAPIILVADDEPQMLRFLESQLSREFTVLTARDGMQALHLARTRTPDLILLDYMMPALDGLHACRELRTQQTTRSIPIIMLTARADEESRLQTLEAGATDFLAKPFSSTELLIRCRNLTALHTVQKQLAHALDDLKAAEEQTIHAAKMASLGQLSAGLLHEVNNPLTFAQGALTAIQRSLAQVPEPARGHLADMLGDLGTGLHRASSILGGLREFAHPSAESHGPVPMDEVLRQASLFVAHLVGPDTTLTLDAAAQPTAHGHRGQLIQIATNLLHNALDSVRSLPPGRPRAVRASWSAHGPMGRLEIRDSGPGIPPEVLPRIFEPFFTTKTVGSGTGLGLSTCHRLVQSHGGAIRAECPPEGGCLFVVDLPLTRPQPETHPGLQTHTTPAHA